MNLYNEFPSKEKLTAKWRADQDVKEVNGHVHSPYSFCSFENMDRMFESARDEGLKVLGINDFNTVDGYDEFARLSRENRIFPLFNIEFMGLMKDLQQKDIRVNDPDNPGRVYFSGKALRYPPRFSGSGRKFLEKVQINSQNQVKEMILKADAHLCAIMSPFGLDYDRIREKYAMNMVRERHIARALRESIQDTFKNIEEQYDFYRRLFEGKELSASLNDEAAVENEIRSVILKKGGKAYVPEDDSAFPDLRTIIEFILEAGGIPCYPVLLDHREGKMTGFERDWDRMHEQFESLRVSCLELIPPRNSVEKLDGFVEFFHGKGYIITFGTEHNAPGAAPVTVRTEKGSPLPPHLKKISWEGCCILGAHQYLVAKGEKGLINEDGSTDLNHRSFYRDLGNAVIKEFTS